MRVWVVLHDDGDYYAHPAVRGLFSSEAAATVTVEVRDPEGRHDRYCCAVEEWEVETDARTAPYGPFRDERTLLPAGVGLIPQSLEQVIYDQLARPGPLTRMVENIRRREAR